MKFVPSNYWYERLTELMIVGATRGEDDPMLTEEQWGVLLEVSGFDGLDGALQDYPEHPEQAASVMFATASLPHPKIPNLRSSSRDKESLVLSPKISYNRHWKLWAP